MKHLLLNMNNDSYYTFKEYFGLVDLVLPRGITEETLENYYKNPNIVLVIIDSMCVGIIMTTHIAYKFDILFKKLNTLSADVSFFYEGGMKIVHIGTDIDTRSWKYFKILEFYNYLKYIDDKSCDELELEFVRGPNTPPPIYDLNFLKALKWNDDIFD